MRAARWTPGECTEPPHDARLQMDRRARVALRLRLCAKPRRKRASTGRREPHRERELRGAWRGGAAWMDVRGARIAEGQGLDGPCQRAFGRFQSEAGAQRQEQ